MEASQPNLYLSDNLASFKDTAAKSAYDFQQFQFCHHKRSSFQEKDLNHDNLPTS